MINFNFNLKDIDFKKISKMDIFTIFIVIALIYNLFKQEIKDTFFVKKNEAGQIVKIDRLGRKLLKSPELQYRVDQLKKIYKCDRVNINLFHNGDSTKTGWHFDKMTCEVESKIDSLPSHVTRLINWRIAPFEKKFVKLLFEEVVYIPDLKKDSDPYFRNTLPQFGAFSIVYVALYDNKMYDPITKKSHLVGFLCFQWGKPTYFNNSDIESMKSERENLYQYVIKK
jgi:hypothetical protein